MNGLPPSYDRSAVGSIEQTSSATTAPQRSQRQEIIDAPPAYEEVPTEGTTLPVPQALLPSAAYRTSASSSRRRSYLGRLSHEAVSYQKEAPSEVPLHFGPPVPPKIKRLLFTKLTDNSFAVFIPGGAILYTSQVEETYAKWKITVSRGRDFTATAESVSNGGFIVRLVPENSQETTVAIKPVIASTLIKFEFSTHDTVYKWRPSRSPLTIGGWYEPPYSAIGGKGTLCLQRMPKKVVVAAYMIGTGVLDMTEELFDDVPLRDAIVVSLFAAKKGHDQYHLNSASIVSLP